MNLLSWLLLPNQFLRYSKFWLQFCIVIFVFTGFINLYIFVTLIPFDYKQGFYIQILFIHVSFAWLSIYIYILISLTSLFFVITKHPQFCQWNDALCLGSLLYVIITLITGAFWGKPMWGTWWVWDARLTSVFILFIILLGIYLLKKSFNDNFQGSFVSSVITLMGLINIPIIKFSVEWWNTLHQPSSITLFSSYISNSLLFLLIGFLLDFFLFSLIIVLIYVRTISLEIKLNKF